MTSGELLDLHLTLVAGPDLDAEQGAEVSRRLRRDLLDLDLQRVEFPPAERDAPDSKGAGLDWTQLILTLSASGGVLTSVIATLRSWLGANQSRTVELTIGKDKLKMTGISSPEQHRIVTGWLERHQKD